MKIVAVSRVLDEADIIEAFVRHTAYYASHHILLDNGSRDGTVDILRKLRDEGLGLTLLQHQSVSFNEQDCNTYIFNMAARVHDADWVLCLDTDEFIDDGNVAGGLGGALHRAGLGEQTPMCLRVPVLEYRPSQMDDLEEPVAPLRIRHRKEPFDNSKIFLRGAVAGPNVTVSGGNHFAHFRGSMVEWWSEPGLKLAHFAERTPYQVAVKYIRGWAKVLAAGPRHVEAGVAGHYRSTFAALRDEPQAFMRNPEFMDAKPSARLTCDPIIYRGGALRYTPPLDGAMHAARTLVGYVEDLASRHGRLMGECAEAKQMVDRWDAQITALSVDPRPAAADVGRPRPAAWALRVNDYSVQQLRLLTLTLNLKYLQAEFYARVTSGHGLPAVVLGDGAGDVVGARKVAFAAPRTAFLIEELAFEETLHVETLRALIASAGSVPASRPAIDLASFAKAAAGADPHDAEGAFDAYATDDNVLLAAWYLESIGSAACRSARSWISEGAGHDAVLNVLAAEPYHSGLIRRALAAKGLDRQARAMSRALESFARHHLPTLDRAGDGWAFHDGSLIEREGANLAMADIVGMLYLDETGSQISGGFFPDGLALPT